MKKLPLILFLAAIAVALPLAWMTLGQTRRSALARLEHAQRMARSDMPDMAGALDELDIALSLAHEQGNDDIEQQVLLTKVEVFEKLSAFQRARECMQTVVEQHRPGDLGMETRLAGLEFRAGEPAMARARLQSVLSVDPERPDAWAWLGSLRAGEAAAASLECERMAAASNLSGERQSKAKALIRKALSRELLPNRRRAILYELAQLYGPDAEAELRALIANIERAALAGQDALEAFSRGFSAREAPAPVLDFIDRLRAAERLDLAGEIALASTRLDWARKSPSFYRSLMTVLREDEKPTLGAEVIELFAPRNLPTHADVALELCRTFYGAKAWPRLIDAADTWKETLEPLYRDAPLFYLAVAYHESEQWGYAPIPTWEYLGRKGLTSVTEVEHGAASVCYRLLARGYRARELAADERMALERYFLTVPEATTLQQRREQGEAYGRLGQLYAKIGGGGFALRAERALTEALCRWPSGYEQYEADWELAGQMALETGAINIDQLVEDLVESRQFVPVKDVSAFELVQIARIHLQRQDAFAAGAVCLRLMDRFPDFSIGLDVAIQAATAAKDQSRLAQLLVRKFELQGPREETRAAIRELPSSAWSPQLRLDMVRLDPAGFGRLRAVHGLVRSKQPELALQALRAIEPDSLDEEARMLGGTLAFQLARWNQVEEFLSVIESSSPLADPALRMRLEAALQLGDAERSRSLLDGCADDPPASARALQPLLDGWIARGELQSTFRLLSAWDAKGTLRDGWMLLRLAQLTWLREGPERAAEHLLRAQAYAPKGSIETGSVLAAAERQDWLAVRAAVERFLVKTAAPTAFQRACCDLLTANVDQARERIRTARLEKHDPRWDLLEELSSSLEHGQLSQPSPVAWTDLETKALVTFLNAHKGQPQEAQNAPDPGSASALDVRQILAMLLAMDDSQWIPWLAARSARYLDQSPEGQFWWLYLRGLALEKCGQPSATQTCALAMLSFDKTSRLAWRLYEHALESQLRQLGLRFDPIGLRPDHPLSMELQEVNAKRLEALRIPIDQDAFALWTRASKLVSDGAVADALLDIDRALELDPDYAEGHLLRARTMADMFDSAGAQAAIERGLVAKRRGTSEDWVAGACKVARELALRDPSATACLDQLAQTFPSDPLPMLNRAALDLGTPDEGLFHMFKALERLDEFRKRHAIVPIESLRPGAAVSWAQVLMAFAPAQAEAFLRQEMLIDPAAPEFWSLLAQVQLEQGDRSGARQTLEVVTKLVPSGEHVRALALLLAETGRDSLRIQELRLAVAEVEGRTAAGDLSFTYAAARSELSAGPNSRDLAIEALEQAWERRREAAPLLRKVRIIQTLAALLCLRDGLGDAAKVARLVPSAIDETQDPLDRTVLVALAGIAAAKNAAHAKDDAQAGGESAP